MTQTIMDIAGELFLEGARDKTPSGGFFSFRALGASMWPMIDDRDLLRVERCGPNVATPGDIIVTEKNGRITAHRLIWKLEKDGEWTIATQGDTMPWRDEPLPGETMLGKVASIEKTGGKVVRLDTSSGKLANRIFLLLGRAKNMLLSGSDRLGVEKIPKTHNPGNDKFWRLAYRAAACVPLGLLNFAKVRDIR